MGMSGGGGTQTSTTHDNSHLPQFEQPAAKAYLSSLMGLIFPGMTMPASWMPKGWDFNPSSSGTSASSGGGQSGQFSTPPVDPTLAYNYLNPMIGSSPSLQKQYAQNPGALTSAMSPSAFNQFNQIYGSMGLA